MSLRTVPSYKPALVFIEEQNPSGVASVTFSNLGTFTHLKILMCGRTSEAATNTVIDLRFNGDTGANYDRQYYGATATALIANESLAQTLMDQVANFSGNNATAGAQGAAEVTIFNYRDTTFWKRVSSIYTYQQTTASAGLLGRTMGGNWRNTAAITSITIQTRAGNFSAGTKISLYGIL